MLTAYIGPHPWEKTDGREVQREFRVEPSEGHLGLLAIGTYNWNTGDDVGTAHLSREQVIELRDALDKWLGKED